MFTSIQSTNDNITRYDIIVKVPMTRVTNAIIILKTFLLYVYD